MGNEITQIPKSMLLLTNLKRLYLSGNHIDDLSVVETMSIKINDFVYQKPESRSDIIKLLFN